MASVKGYIGIKGVLIWTMRYLSGCLFYILQYPQQCVKSCVNLVSLDHIMRHFAFYAYFIVLYIEESLHNCGVLTF